MIGLQDMVLKQNIKVQDLAKEIKINPSEIWRWFRNNKIPKARLKQLSERFNVDEEYLSKQVNEINTYRSRHRGFNDYRVVEENVFIILRDKYGKIVGETIVDKSELTKLIDLNWSWHIRASKRAKESEEFNYAVTTYYYLDKDGKQKHRPIYLHNTVLDVESNKKYHINHKNHDTLDNRKFNLELVPTIHNAQLRNKANCNNKTTGVRNVNYIKHEDVYRVQFCKNYKRFSWTFPSDQFEQACDFARQKRIELFGKE